jgi:hypothetical protein
MAGSTSATVETLVAEVRVLMVGSRQVTLSVARQLDWVDLEDMEPFGRVRLDTSATVIGRDRDTGALVLASYQIAGDPVFLDGDNLERPITVCATLLLDGISNVGLTVDGVRLLVSRALVRSCTVPAHAQYQFPKLACAPPIDLHGQLPFVRAALAAHAEGVRLRQSMNDLPLIVLAGLR